MSLEEYRRKRDFGSTPEPAAADSASNGALRFVVQKHRASRLHYDLRLEAGGVLKSWAVPKGPSLNPEDKRLAMMVEDHPMDYRDFEGTIPAGNYGAGTVMVWDTGTYRTPGAETPEDAERAVLEGLEKGHVTVCLAGSKLNGEFALIKTKDREENAWLLIKAGDEVATEADVTTQDRSALTGRNLDEIAGESAAAGDVWGSGGSRGAQIEVPDAPESAMPRNLRPMLATAVEEPFDRDGWAFEVKWDGYRALAGAEQGSIKLYSRGGLPLNERYPSIVEALSQLGHKAVLDGEIVVVDASGVSQFGMLQNYKPGDPGLVYYVFDILWLDGHDVRGLPLRRRRDLLSKVLPLPPLIRVSEQIERQGVRFFEVAAEHGLEGIVAKDLSSTYRSGARSRDWLKIKAHRHIQAVIGGFTEPRGGRKHLGALVLGKYDNGKLVYIGHTGGGSRDSELKLLRERLDPLERPTSPFEKPPRTNAPVHWVEPVLTSEVVFTGWTDDGILRQPILKGVTETSRQSPPRPRATNTKKIYWPDEGYTKGDLLAYYKEVSAFILPHLRDRPESLHRFPDGVGKSGFYQKDVPEAPDWVVTEKIQSDSEGDDIEYVVCQDEATLMYLANLGCIEMNPWLSRVGSLDNPDFLVIDLDPEDITFEAVIRTASVVKEVLDAAGVVSYPKTSGATGLHIYVPLSGKYSYSSARRFAEIVAVMVNRRLPEITSIERSPSKRQQRVYVDYLQNKKGATVAAPYSVRPVPGATVSTPLNWDEVAPGLSPAQFTIRTIMQRLEKKGDIFAPVLGEGVDLSQALEKLKGK